MQSNQAENPFDNYFTVDFVLCYTCYFGLTVCFYFIYIFFNFYWFVVTILFSCERFVLCVICVHKLLYRCCTQFVWSTKKYIQLQCKAFNVA